MWHLLIYFALATISSTLQLILWPFRTLKWQFSYLFTYYELKKRHPFRAEPPRIAHCREYPPGFLRALGKCLFEHLYWVTASKSTCRWSPSKVWQSNKKTLSKTFVWCYLAISIFWSERVILGGSSLKWYYALKFPSTVATQCKKRSMQKGG